MKTTLITRKENIVFSIIDLINEIGLKELSIKEIAKRENITEAAIYKHFKSKDEMLLEVLNYYSKYDNNIYNTIENSTETEKQKIIASLDLLSQYFESYPALTSVYMSYSVLLYEEIISEKLKEIHSKRINFINSLIKNGQLSGNISNNITAENLTDILVGTYGRIISKWRFSNYSFSLKEKTVEVVSNILNLL